MARRMNATFGSMMKARIRCLRVMSNGRIGSPARLRVMVFPSKRLTVLPCICFSRSCSLAAAFGGNGTHQRGGVVLHLFFHNVVHFAAAQGHRMRRAGIGARSHGSHVCAFENEEARRRGPAAA